MSPPDLRQTALDHATRAVEAGDAAAAERWIRLARALDEGPSDPAKALRARLSARKALVAALEKALAEAAPVPLKPGRRSPVGPKPG